MYHYSSLAFNVNAVTDNELKMAQGLFYKKCILRPPYTVKHLVENVFFYIKNYDVLMKLLRVIKII